VLPQARGTARHALARHQAPASLRRGKANVSAAFFSQHFLPSPLKQTISIMAGDQTPVREAACSAEPLGCPGSPGSTHSTRFKTLLRSIPAEKSKDVPRTRKKKKAMRLKKKS